MDGIVFDIQRFCLHDGPGIRTTVFLKGCFLRCIWCHNPEAIAPQPQLSVGKNGQRMIGKQMCVAEVMDVVARDRAYYANSGGGVTLSGGEPMYQMRFTRALLQEAKAHGWHTCLDTSGYGKRQDYEAIADLVDLFLFDIKAHDPVLHTELTGVSSLPVLTNLDYLSQRGAAIVLRCPLVPGVNDSLEHLRFIAELSVLYPDLRGVEIMPYHRMASEKWRSIGLPFALEGHRSADDSIKKQWLDTLHKMGCQKIM